MKKRMVRLKWVGLMTVASMMGVASLVSLPQAKASNFDSAIATYYGPREYHPVPKYSVPGQLNPYSQGRINVRTGPGTEYYARHYGIKGDRITVLNQALGNDGYQWWYLKFNQSGAKGWVREDLVFLNH